MNLFIFRVETGTMLEFQLDMATESVAQLKQEITKIVQVPPKDQVLLVSGGISLSDSAKVMQYSAGTDTNPIFLFCIQSIESPYPPSASPSPHAYKGLPTATAGIDNDSCDGAPISGESSYVEFRDKVKQSRSLPVSMETVTHRASLAQKFYEDAERENSCCQGIVHDQHLQHQGWAAAIANLEDTTLEFQRRLSEGQKFFSDFLRDRDSFVDFLKDYKNVIGKLAKIPIIPTLLETQLEPSSSPAIIVEETLEASTLNEESQSSSADVALESAADEDSAQKRIYLLDWIEARKDSSSESTMDMLYDTSLRGIECYQQELFEGLYQEAQCAVDAASKKDMKEIHGLSERLYNLNSLIDKAASHVKEQEYLSESIQKNQSRAGILGDTSVLPDLCNSHKKQLVDMLKNHWKLCDIHKRCMKSKEELCTNLYHRLKWVIYVQNLVRMSHDRLLLYYENVHRLRYSRSVLQQIHVAPEAYISSLVEVVRRKTFSQAFLLWASELACYMLTIYNDEMTKRKEFKAKYDGHFLMGLFPGMSDLPPSFATQAPSIFDSSLPNVSIEDVEELRKAIPELSELLIVPDMSAITNFFLTKSVKTDGDKAEDTCVEEKLVQVIKDVGLTSNLDQNLLKATESEICLHPQGISQLKDLDKGCESETDTEEFEKVCQSPMELQFDKELPSPRPGTSDLTTLPEVGENCFQAQHQSLQISAPRKPPRTFQSYSKSVSESFTNITKNTSLESIDELSSLKNANDSCINAQQHLHDSQAGHTGFARSKSLSPHMPTSHDQIVSPASPMQSHQPSDFVNEEFYIDESLPSSLSIDATCAHANEHIAKQLSNANDVVAMLQDNLQTSRSEQDKLKDHLLNMATFSRVVIAKFRQEMEIIREHVKNEGCALQMHCRSLSSSWDNLASEFDQKEKEICKLTQLHDAEVTSFKVELKSQADDLKCLREENSCLDSSLNKMASENKTLLESLSSANDYATKIAMLEAKVQEQAYEKDRSIKETVDRLNCEHRSEIDNLRKKFRLMTDRSPSECLEKSVATETDAKRQHNFDVEKQRALEELKFNENARFDKILEERNKEFEFELNELRDECKRNAEEKDKSIQVLHEHEETLNLECTKYKNALLQLTELKHVETSNSELLQQIDDLKKANQQLELALFNERLEKYEGMDSSDITMIMSTSSSIAPKRLKFKESLTSSVISLGNATKVNVNSCSKNDTVLVMWKPEYKHFIVFQESDVLFFVYFDMVKELEAQILANATEDKRMHFNAIVLDKQYCQTKKSENRYNVPKGTKFYRVKVRPLNIFDEYQRASQLSHSQTVVRSASVMDDSVSDSACHSLPSSPTKEEK